MKDKESDVGGSPPRTSADDDASRASRLSALYDLALRLSSVHDLPALLQDIVGQARRLTVADIAYIALRESDDAVTINVTDGSIGPRLRGVRLPAGRGLAGQVIERGEPVQSIDYLQDSALNHFSLVDDVAAEEHLSTILGVPLRLRGVVTGVLMVALRKPRSFSSDELSLLSSLGAIAAVAIENVRLIDQYRETAGELARTNRALQERVEAIAQAAQLHDRMLEVALQGGGAEQVVQSLSAMLKVQVILLDEQDRVQIRAAADQVDRVDAGAESREAVSARFSMPSTRHTYVSDHTVIVPIATARAYYGAILVQATLDEWGVRALERAAMTLTLVAAAERAQAEADRRRSDELLEQLVTRRVDDAATFARRAQSMGLDVTALHCVLLLRPAPEMQGRVLARAAAFARSGGLAAVVLGEVVVLARVTDSEARDFAVSLAPLGGNVGLGGPATGVSALALAYDDARACLSVLDALERTASCASPADLGPYRFLLSEAGRADASAFIRQTVGPLLEYDAERNSDLTHTTMVFLRSGRQHAAAASELRIHPNTLYQRLDRITERLGEGWRSGDRALDVQMALRLHGLMSRVDDGPPGRPAITEPRHRK